MPNKEINQEDYDGLHKHLEAVAEIMLRIGEFQITYKKPGSPLTVRATMNHKNGEPIWGYENAS